MEELKSLINVVSKNKVKQIDVIGNSKNRKSQAQQLYDKIASGEIESDEQIVDSYFKDKANAAFYSSRLKQKLKDRLINTLFFIDINQPDINEYRRAYYTAYKQSVAVKILLSNFARKAAIPLAERVVKNAILFELTDIAYTLCVELSLHYATIDGNKRKFEEYDSLAQKYMELLTAESRAVSHFARIGVYFSNTKSFQREAVEEARSYSDELMGLAEKLQANSFRFNYYSYLVHCYRYEINNEYAQLLEVCNEALTYFYSKKDMVPKTALFSFTLRKFICNTQLKKYEDAWTIIPECIDSTVTGSYNWFLALTYFITLAFHTGRFQDAYEFYLQAKNNSQYNKLQKNVAELWIVYEAFIYYFIFIKRIKPDDRNPLKKFRVSKFVNDVPMFSKDKQGINISILILQILFLLHEQRYNEIIDKTESLRTYTHRYLRQDDTFRSHCFIRMLLTLPDGSFHKKAVLRKAEPFWKKLQSKPIQVANQIAEVEPVPYETLWSFVLESLDEKWH